MYIVITVKYKHAFGFNDLDD